MKEGKFRPHRNWPARPVAGVCLHFTSLPSPLGIGDIGDAAIEFVDRLEDMNLRTWQVLPIGPTSFGDSPYQTLSTFAGNELLIGLEPLVRMGLLENEDLQPLKNLPAGTVEFGSLAPAKRALLAKAAGQFACAATQRDVKAYEAFCKAAGETWLDDYALFRALKTKHGERAWNRWEPPLARREPIALRHARETLKEQVETHRIIQFFFDQQWRSLRDHAADRGISLIGDIPFYIAHDSADAWANPKLLLMDESGQPSQVSGVPPDYFSEDGQLWGNPVYDWTFQKETGYSWWIERLAHAARQHDLVRIDHFRGFKAFWSVPYGETTAKGGAWNRGPGKAFFKAARRRLGSLPIVAEDLGLITPGVVKLRKKQGFPGMRVLQFELLDPEFDASDIPEDCICYTGTHDNDTTVGWFNGQGVEKKRPREIRALRRRALKHTNGEARTIHTDMVRLAFSTRARIAIAPMQDYLGLGSEARLNTPGSAEGNWRWRMTAGQLTAGLIDRVSTLVRESSRDHPGRGARD